jgi:hypothetical protein
MLRNDKNSILFSFPILKVQHNHRLSCVQRPATVTLLRMLTKFTPSGVKPGAITVYISGNRPRTFMENQTVRYAAYDGRMSYLDSGASSEFIPVISDNWTKHFSWLGVGPLPQAEREKLNSIVSTAHADGQKVRFWATPDLSSLAREALWKELLKADVDFINTDYLADLEEFLKKNDPNPENIRNK